MVILKQYQRQYTYRTRSNLGLGSKVSCFQGNLKKLGKYSFCMLSMHVFTGDKLKQKIQRVVLFAFADGAGDGVIAAVGKAYRNATKTDVFSLVLRLAVEPNLWLTAGIGKYFYIL